MNNKNKKVKTYCRICEAHCGLEVDVTNDEQIVAVRADKSHPVSKGFACIKGTSIDALHTDNDRINFPMKRVDGELKRISWEQAIREIGDKVRQLRSQYDDRAIGMYQGNPTYFSFQNIMYSSAFLESLHSPNIFASHSIDGNNKYQAATEIYGRSMVHPVPDLDNTQFFMCFGSNPTVSQMSIIQVINPLEKFKGIEKRGGKVVFVDPRRTETASKAGEHVAIKPGTDVYLLLAMLHVIAHENPLDTRSAVKHAHGVHAFVDCARDWTPEKVAPLTGIQADQIRRLALEYRDSDGAALYMSTGLNMGPFGTLCYWLIQGLNYITGNTDRQGGLLLPRGAFDALKLAQAIGLGSFDDYRTLDGKWHRVAGCFPVSALAGEIDNDHPKRIRALFISAGNPVHSVPNGEALAQAMKKLELTVCIDIYPSETSQYADYILPATDMLERSDFAASHMVLQAVPHAQFTEAVVAPKFERRPEWQIYSDLALACGAGFSLASVCNLLPHLNRLLGKLPIIGKHQSIHPDTLLSLLLRWGGQVTMKQLKSHPQGILLGPTPPGSFFGKRVPTKDGKIQLWPLNLTRDLERVNDSVPLFEDDEQTLRLIGQRQRRSQNSWMHNNAAIKQPSGNAALMHPDDASARDIANGDTIQIITDQATVDIKVQLTPTIAKGVVAVPHGWGHQKSGLSRAAALPGTNINKVIPGGPENMEPVSGQAIMMAHTVQVVKKGDSVVADSDVIKKTKADLVAG